MSKVDKKINKKEKIVSKNINKVDFVFGKKNYILIAIGCVFLMIGYVLMIGGKMENPNEFDPNVVFSFRTTTLSILFCLAGFGLNLYAIFAKSK